MTVSTRNKHGNWREDYEWTWVGTFTFLPVIPYRGAIRMFNEFVATLQAIEQRPLSWVRVVENESHFGKYISIR